ncbi:MAG: carboxypeptidase-like regulatory domain-containing protein [Bacteroidales bacterium]|nr:carboxypeptidase-like regulatory domain-containing protein [Bacteroidales bacterium]
MNKCCRRFFLLPILCWASIAFAQPSKVFKGCVVNDLQHTPLENACIHNISTGMATFSNAKGNFALIAKGKDTLVVTHVGYAARVLVLEDTLSPSDKRHLISMEMKSILLKGTTVYALKPYPIFLTDVAKEANAVEESITLSGQQKSDATARTEPHLYNGSPITMLYDCYSRKAQLARHYRYLSTHEEESRQLSRKYNAAIVARLTGLQGEELEAFMCYCAFSYYDLVKAPETEIARMITNKFSKYRKQREK